MGEHSEVGRRELRRARQELSAARALIESGFATQAVSRAYYAAFFAAEAALLSIGQSRSKHSGVISAFGQHIVREGGLDSRHGKALRSLFDRRNTADYSLEAASAEEAQIAADEAGALVDAVEKLLAVSG